MFNNRRFKISLWIILFVIIISGLRLPEVLDCNPEIVRILDNIPGEELFIHKSITMPFVMFYLSDYNKISTGLAVEMLKSGKKGYILVHGEDAAAIMKLIEQTPEFKGNLNLINVGDRGFYLITNSREKIEFNIPARRNTLYYCYRYMPIWLDYNTD